MNYSVLNKIQQGIKVGKDRENTFGGFNYRSATDILEELKPMLPQNFVVILTDEVVGVGNRVYIKATATITDGTEVFTASAYAREAETKTKMDDAQITGSASSYARKYALAGLLALDDENDPDSMDNSVESKPQTPPTVQQTPSLGKCVKCGAPNTKYQSGKIGCSKFCWKQGGQQ